VFAVRGDEIELLLTDVIMPETNGPALAHEILAIRPNLPVLFISGHADIEPDALGLDHPGVGFLPKPIRSSKLTAKVRELLGHAGAPAVAR
jgi:two-component system cell cycle sensor histidine kinase/response regulator CckA